MCFNSTISINTFAFSIFAAIFGYLNGILSPDLVGLVVSFAVIQLLEWRTWKLLDGRKPIDRLTALAYPFVFVFLQPAAAAAVYLNNRETVEARIGATWARRATVLILASLAALWIVGVFVYARYTPRIAPSPVNGRLMYNLKDPKHRVLAMVVLVLYLATFVLASCLAAPAWLAVIMVATLLISVAGWLSTKTWGTMWCYTANVASLWIVFMVFKKAYFMRSSAAPDPKTKDGCGAVRGWAQAHAR